VRQQPRVRQVGALHAVDQPGALALSGVMDLEDRGLVDLKVIRLRGPLSALRLNWRVNLGPHGLSPGAICPVV
jgi:hypothetical protein